MSTSKKLTPPDLIGRILRGNEMHLRLAMQYRMPAILLLILHACHFCLPELCLQAFLSCLYSSIMHAQRIIYEDKHMPAQLLHVYPIHMMQSRLSTSSCHLQRSWLTNINK